MTSFEAIELAYKLFEPDTCSNTNLCPVIFLHKMGTTKEDWVDVPQIIANRTKRKAYALDARNHGDSGYADIFDLNDNAGDLLHFLDSHEIPKAALVGHSMGGITAMQTALREPERVEMIFIEDLYTKRPPQKAFNETATYIKFWLNGLKKVPKCIPPQHVQSYIIDYFLSKTTPHARKHIDIKSLQKSYIPFVQKSDGHYDLKLQTNTLLQTLKDVSHIKENVGQYHGPAYFVFGELSAFQVDKEEMNIKSHFPNAELFKIKNASHNVHVDCSDEFTDIVSCCLLKYIS